MTEFKATTVVAVTVAMLFVLSGCARSSDASESVSLSSQASTIVSQLTDSESNDFATGGTITLSQALTSGEYPIWYLVRSDELRYSSVIDKAYVFNGADYDEYGFRSSYDAPNVNDLEGLSDDLIKAFFQHFNDAKTDKGRVKFRGDRDNSGNRVEEERFELTSSYEFEENYGPVTILSEQYFGLSLDGYCFVTKVRGDFAPEIVLDDMQSPIWDEEDNVLH